MEVNWEVRMESTEQIGLRGEDALMWEGYISNLRISHARIKEANDELIW